MKALNDVLKSILDMDKQARAKKEEAEKYRKDIYSKIEQEKNDMMKLKFDNARKKVETINQGFQKGAEKKVELLKQQNDELSSQLQKKYKENGARWVEELYERILNAE